MLKSIMIGLAMASLGLAACTEAPTTQTSSTASAIDPLVGKNLVSENATFIFDRDGTFGGNFRGEPIVGTYTASATEICSTITEPENIAGERCSTPEYNGNTVIFNRRDGSQSALYQIEG